MNTLNALFMLMTGLNLMAAGVYIYKEEDKPARSFLLAAVIFGIGIFL